MKILKNIILLFFIVLTISGCGTILRLGAGDQIDTRFISTRFDVCILRDMWAEKCQNSAGYLENMKIVTPLPIIDLPFAIALDTLLLPFDVYSYNQENKALKFWQDAFESGIISEENIDNNLTKNSLKYIERTIPSRELNENVHNAIFNMAIHNNDVSILKKLASSNRPYLSAEECQTLYDWQTSNLKNGSWHIFIGLIKNPNVPNDILRKLSTDKNQSIASEAEKSLTNSKK